MLNQLAFGRFGNRRKTHKLISRECFEQVIGKLVHDSGKAFGAGVRKVEQSVASAEVE
ncbi:hypothetical protein D3C78_1152310 [compost metagenome]